MPGERELIALLPPILLTARIPSVIGGSTLMTLSDARIEGSADATYGTIGWTPLESTPPFVFISSGKADEGQYETSRTRTKSNVHLFFAVAEANVPPVGISPNDLAVAWRDAMRELIPQHRRLSPEADNAWPDAGDVRWEMGGSDIKKSFDILGVAYYGVDITTILSWTTIVQFQG